MADTDAPQNAPNERQDASPQAPSEGAEGREGVAPYDTAKEGYAGISTGTLDSLRELHDARNFAEMIVDTVREGLLVLDFDLCVQAANESFYDTFGVRPEETVGRRVYDLGNRQWDIPELRKLLEEILPHNRVFNEYEVEHGFEGIGRRVMILNARRLDDHQLILLAIQDVTAHRAATRERAEREHAEAALAASNSAFHHLADAVPHLVWAARPDGTVDYYNAQAASYGGLRHGQDGTWEWAPVLHPDDVERTEEMWQRALATGEPYEIEHRVRMANGAYRWHVSRARASRDTAGEIIQWYGTATDIHRVKETEEALRENEERLRRAQQAANVGTWDLDLVTGEVLWSEGLFEIVGLPLEAGVPSADAWNARLHPQDRGRVEEQVQAAIESGGDYENEFRIVRPDGRVVWVAAKGHVLRDEAGRPVRLLGANYDITARKRTEEALRLLNESLEERVESRTRQIRRHQERINQLSRALALAEQEERRRIAHVLHDDLQQILFGAQMAHSFGDSARLGDILQEALALTRSLSHELSPPFLQGEDVEDLLRWLAERKRERYGLEIEVEVGGGIPVPNAEVRVLLYQLLRELLFNVVKHAGTDRARVVAERTDEHVRITVEDEGVGFTPAALDDPTAVGLGLPSVRERLELVGGQIEVASAPGEGTRVTITLPIGKATDEGA